MNPVQKLIYDVSVARDHYLHTIASVPEAEAAWKPDADAWNITEVTEHLFWAEHGGLYGMWKTLLAIREGSITRNMESDHQGMSIEQIIDQTWKPKEIVPAVAAPRMGGTLAFWRVSLHSLQAILEAFGNVIKEDELRLQAHPHPISGAMDFQQRIEFLRFHINRHQIQVSEIMAKYNGQNKNG